MMFLTLLHCQEEQSNAKKRKLEQIATASHEVNATKENDQDHVGDQLANKSKTQTTVNQFYKKQEENIQCGQESRICIQMPQKRGDLYSDLSFLLYDRYFIQCGQESRICKDGSNDRQIW